MARIAGNLFLSGIAADGQSNAQSVIPRNPATSPRALPDGPVVPRSHRVTHAS
jgi:hypothetical protein